MKNVFFANFVSQFNFSLLVPLCTGPRIPLSSTSGGSGTGHVTDLEAHLPLPPPPPPPWWGKHPFHCQYLSPHHPLVQPQVCCLHHHLPFHQGHHYPLLHCQIWVLWECHHHLLPDLLNLHLQEQHEKKLQLLQSCTQEWMKRWLFP